MKEYIMPLVGIGWVILMSVVFWHWSRDDNNDDDDFGAD